MTDRRTPRPSTLLLSVILAAALSACAAPPPQARPLTVRATIVTRWQGTDPLVLEGVTNTASHRLSRVVITSRCHSDQRDEVTTFKSEPLAFEPGEVKASVLLHHYSGPPYASGFVTLCLPEARNLAPGEPDTWVERGA